MRKSRFSAFQTPKEFKMKKKKKSRAVYRKGRKLFDMYVRKPVKVIFETKDGKKIALKGTKIIPKTK